MPPLYSGSSPSVVSRNIRELHKGPQFSRTRRKFGPKRAQAQAVAIALAQKRKPKRKARM